MVKRVVVSLLVAALLLTAIPAALSVEFLSPSISSHEHPASHPQLASVMPALSLESVEESEVSEGDSFESFLGGSRAFHQLVPAFHRSATHARDAHRSRVPAVRHGRSPPC